MASNLGQTVVRTEFHLGVGQRKLFLFVTRSFGHVLLYPDQLCAVGAIYSVVHQCTHYPPFATPDNGSPLVRALPHDIYDLVMAVGGLVGSLTPSSYKWGSMFLVF